MQYDAELNTKTTNQSPVAFTIASDRRAYYFTKRVLDIVLSSLMLLVASPVMLLIAVAIKLYSPGPVFFVQERVGARRVGNGKTTRWQQTVFRCLKFRTMHVNADPSIHEAYVKALIKNDVAQMDSIQGESTAVRKLVRDDRITRPGKLLRKLSLDELPQLWNVLRGDMSLVGPRPAIPYEVEVYTPWHMLRLQAQPGLTGLQQVTERCTADFDEQVQLDIRYIENQSLWTDLVIIIKTPLAVLSTRGAG